MKYHLLSLFILLFLFSCAKTVKNDLSKSKLNGSVLSVREITFEAVEKAGKIIQGDTAQHVMHFSSKYNTKGNLLEEIRYNWGYKKTIYKHDNTGNIIETNRYDADGNLNSKTICKYDDAGNRMEANTYDADENLSSKAIYKHDDVGNIIEMNLYNPDDSCSSQKTYKYDNSGNPTEVNSYRPDDESFIYKQTHKYDNSENKIQSILCVSDEHSNYEYTYKYKYEKYDNNNNWLTRIELFNNKPCNITERKIEYYD